MKKLPLITFLLFLSNLLQAQEIFLSCNIKKYAYASTEKMERKDIKQLIPEIKEILLISTNEINKNISITPQSDNLEFSKVSTEKSSYTKLVENLSSEKKYHIINEVMFPGDNVLNIHEININRLSGQIYTRHTYTIDRVTFNHIGNGNCEKIDSYKKKF